MGRKRIPGAGKPRWGTNANASDGEPDHVAGVGSELRIVRELELPPTVVLQPVRLPDRPNRTGADAKTNIVWETFSRLLKIGPKAAELTS
jgi:hypothetical protein